MLTVEEALSQVLQQAQPSPETIRLPAGDCLGLVLAEDILADVDSPPHDKALVDGYAVQRSDLVSGEAVELSVIEEVTAGSLPAKTLAAGQATRIMTGAPIPTGADGVVMVEQTELVDAADDGGSRVRIEPVELPASGHIMQQAASFAVGDLILRAGTLLRGIEIGAAAEVGRTELEVRRRPTLSVMTSGNELVTPDQKPHPGQIRNSNNSMLTALATLAGAAAQDLGIAADTTDDIARLIRQGLGGDVLVLSGGVSAGVLDLVPSVLSELGVVEVFHKIQMKPGKPLWFGVFREAQRQTLVFGLPGNPVSSLVCFELFVRPAIDQIAGRSQLGLARSTAVLSQPHRQRGPRPTYFPARILDHPGEPTQVEPLPWQGSADLASLTAATALAYFPPGDRQYEAGETVEVLRLPG